MNQSISPAELRQAAAALAFIDQHLGWDELSYRIFAAKRETPRTGDGHNGRHADVGINHAEYERFVGKQLAAYSGLDESECIRAAQEAIGGTQPLAAVREIINFARQLREEISKQEVAA